MIKLTVLTGPDAGSVFTPASDTIVIGRSSDCDVVLHDSTMSRCHCRIQREGGNFVVCDLHSANGTFLNDPKARIDTHTLSHGDKIIFGKSCLQVELPAPVKEELLTTITEPAAGDAPSPESLARAVDVPLPSDIPLSLPSNWATGMTVFAPRPKMPAAPENPMAATGRTDPGREGILARLTSRVKRLIIALKNGIV